MEKLLRGRNRKNKPKKGVAGCNRGLDMDMDTCATRVNMHVQNKCP